MRLAWPVPSGWRGRSTTESSRGPTQSFGLSFTARPHRSAARETLIKPTKSPVSCQALQQLRRAVCAARPVRHTCGVERSGCPGELPEFYLQDTAHRGPPRPDERVLLPHRRHRTAHHVPPPAVRPHGEWPPDAWRRRPRRWPTAERHRPPPLEVASRGRGVDRPASAAGGAWALLSTA